jgi:hypothetical protein
VDHVLEDHMVKLTERTIKKLPRPASGIAEYSDDLLPGLVLRRHSSGGDSWCARYRVKGSSRQRRLTLGKWPALNLSRARELAAKELRRVADGDDPSGQREAAKEADRTGQLKDGFVDNAIRFVESYCRPRNKSWVAQARLLGLSLDRAARRDPTREHHWTIIPGSPADRWRKRTVASITKRDVVEAVDAAAVVRRSASSRRHSGGPVLANRTHATLTRFFGWAVEKGLIAVSPADGTKAPSVEKPRERVLSPQELSTIWWAAARLKPPFGAFTRLLILTAARRNEVSGATAETGALKSPLRLSRLLGSNGY